MVKHECLKEADIATIKEQIATVFHILNGNGEDGLLKKLDRLSDAMIKLESYNHIKQWVMGTAITLLFGALCWALTELYHAKLG